MARRQKGSANPSSPPPAPPAGGIDALGLATLAGTIAVLVISFSNLRAIDRIEGDIGQLERRMERVAQAPTQPTAAPTPAQQPPPRRTGPDPEKVYEIEMANAPSKGPAGAPIVIAEFSDFQ